ncbi:HPr family phosphocarrier protein [Clostridium botulinum]|nr:HPr family phosphocarrier protein [Clostridium botulinum]
MLERELTVNSSTGLHARPATLLVKRLHPLNQIYLLNLMVKSQHKESYRSSFIRSYKWSKNKINSFW